jgi:hypothetical protein
MLSDTHLLQSFCLNYANILSTLSGITLVWLTGLHKDDLAEAEIIVVYVTDWPNAPQVEKTLHGGHWSGKEVYVVRERVVELVNGEEFLEPALVGGRAGGGGMTSELLLKDNIGGETWMLQCRHGYGAIDEDCFYPSPSGIKAAVDQVDDTLKANLQNHCILTERLQLLREAEDLFEKLDGTARFRNTGMIPYLSIGRVKHLSSPHLDAALIKLHLSQRPGVARQPGETPQKLRAPTGLDIFIPEI